jgi:hypothetical protein
MVIKESRTGKELQNEPFRILGYGMNSFFDIMLSLAIMFLCISLVMSPIIYTYAHNEF